MRVDDGDLGVTRERRLAGEAFVQHAAEGVDVGSMVDGAALDLLGRGVVDRAEEESGPRQAGRGSPLHDPEVGHERALGALLDQDVRRFDVAVDELSRVRGVEAAGRLLKDEERPRQRERAAAPEQ